MGVEEFFQLAFTLLIDGGSSSGANGNTRNGIEDESADGRVAFTFSGNDVSDVGENPIQLRLDLGERGGQRFHVRQRRGRVRGEKGEGGSFRRRVEEVHWQRQERCRGRLGSEANGSTAIEKGSIDAQTRTQSALTHETHALKPKFSSCKLVSSVR